jgi:hypothetical protein
VRLRAWNRVFGIRGGGSVRGRLLFLLMVVVMMMMMLCLSRFDVRGWTMLGGLTSRHDLREKRMRQQ